MALFSVVPELRARGFQINLAAWYCWQNDTEKIVRADSCAIFRLGPCQGIMMCFDASAFGLPSPELPPNCSMVMEMLRDGDGRIVGTRNFSVPKFFGAVVGVDQAYPLEDYAPHRDPLRRQRFVSWTFTPCIDKDSLGSPAVSEIMEMTTRIDAFPFGVDTSIGYHSWSWPEHAPSEQKLVSFEKSDLEEQTL